MAISVTENSTHSSTMARHSIGGEDDPRSHRNGNMKALESRSYSLEVSYVLRLKDVLHIEIKSWKMESLKLGWKEL